MTRKFKIILIAKPMYSLYENKEGMSIFHPLTNLFEIKHKKNIPKAISPTAWNGNRIGNKTKKGGELWDWSLTGYKRGKKRRKNRKRTKQHSYTLKNHSGCESLNKNCASAHQKKPQHAERVGHFPVLSHGTIGIHQLGGRHGDRFL